MEWLNYHHLYTFWVVAHAGGITAAARRLHVTHSTLSAQLKALEEFLGEPLFDRRGRSLVLNSAGGLLLPYADDIFHLGAELLEVARGRASARVDELRVGTVGSLPRTLVRELLEPAFRHDRRPCRAVLRQGALASLLEDLEARRLHLLISDQPPPPGTSRGTHTHLLGEGFLSIAAPRGVAARYRRGFPRSLHGAPMLLPDRHSTLRVDVERWFIARGLALNVQGEFDDNAMLRAFAERSRALFVTRDALATEIQRRHGFALVGRLEGLKERYYAVTGERRVKNARVAAVIAQAQRALDPERRSG